MLTNNVFPGVLNLKGLMLPLLSSLGTKVKRCFRKAVPEKLGEEVARGTSNKGHQHAKEIRTNRVELHVFN